MSHVNGVQRLPRINSHRTEENYRLAQKLFQSRKFQQSLLVSKQVYEEALSSFQNDSQREKTLVKAACLHMIIAGVLAKEVNSSSNSVASELKSDFIIADLRKIYGSSPLIPSQIWYHYFLALAGMRALEKGNSHFEVLDRLTIELEERGVTDIHYSKLMNLYVFEVLPSNDCYKKAQGIVRNHRQYQDIIDESISRLADVKASKKDVQKNQKDAKRQENAREKTTQIAGTHGLTPSEKANNLRRVLELISIPSEINASQEPVEKSQFKEIDRAMYLLKTFLAENGIWAILAVTMALVSRRFLKKANVDIKRKLIETLKTAFQISYI